MSETLPAIGHNSGDYTVDVDRVEDYSVDVDADSTALFDAGTVAAKAARVPALAKLQVEREREVSRLEGELAMAKKNLHEVANRDLPLLLQDLGVALLPLANGAKVQLKKKTVASLKKEDRSTFIPSGLRPAGARAASPALSRPSRAACRCDDAVCGTRLRREASQAAAR